MAFQLINEPFSFSGEEKAIVVVTAGVPLVVPPAPAINASAEVMMSNAMTPVEEHGQLRARGGKLYDKSSNPVVLRGMSLYWSQSGGKYYDKNTIRWLRDDWNVNVIRAAVGIDLGGYMDNPKEQFRHATDVIQAAIDLGVYVIVDWHSHEMHKTEAGDFFKRISAMYGAYPNVIYEIYNEPYPKYDWHNDLKPYHYYVISRIRVKDPDNLVIVGTPEWSQGVDVAAREPILDSNVAYALHFYAATHKEPLRQRAEAALSKGLTLFVSEWGASAADGGGALDVAETDRWWQWMEDRQISYVNWSITDRSESSAALLPNAPVSGWADSQISSSGIMIRARMRCKNSRETYATWIATALSTCSH